VEKLNWVMSKSTREFAQAENSAKQITSMGLMGGAAKNPKD